MEPKIRKIIHLHDVCNGHATLTVKEAVEYSIEHGYTKLVYTEHSPMEDNDNIFRPTRKDIVNLRKEIEFYKNKYPQLEIEFGYEIEYPTIRREYFTAYKDDPLADFLIFGNHFLGDVWGEYKSVINHTKTKADLDLYLEYSKAAIESGLFSLFAHPDLWLANYGRWDQDAIDLTQDLIKLCEKYDMPMGFNANGMHYPRDKFFYPCKPFWNLIGKSKVKVIIESDAHCIQTMSVEWMNKAYDEAIKQGLGNNLINDIKIKKFD